MSKRLDSTKWLRKKANELKGEGFNIHYAALLHIYLGALSFEEIADKAEISLDTLQRLRRNASFMKLVDNLKKEFSGEVKADLLINNYQFEEYDSFASDFTMLDEMVQMQIKVPLITQLRKLSRSIQSRTTYHLKIDKADFMLFRRLFSFFIFVEKYSPSLISDVIIGMKKIAEDVVWPSLDLDKSQIDDVFSREVLSKDKRLKILKEKLSSSL